MIKIWHVNGPCAVAMTAISKRYDQNLACQRAVCGGDDGNFKKGSSGRWSGQAKNSMEQKAISDCETGNPPEGWESEGQLRISNLKKQEKKNF
jgi:hypothetical protein